MTVEIREHLPGKNVEPFIDAGDQLFADDPSWIAPLRFEFRARLNPRKSPFFDYAEACFWTGWRGDRIVGRCSAQIDRLYQQTYGDHAGFFGFFDTIDDAEVAQALLARAEAWLRQRGAKKMIGPYSLSFKEEFGLLVDGFEHPPMVGMGHSRPFQGALAESYGLQKVKDFFAWRYDVGAIPERAQRAWREVCTMPDVRMRRLDKRHLRRELDAILEVFNDAWKDNWGYVPATARDAEKMAEEFKLVLDVDLTILVEVDGKVQGFCIAVPNLNEVIRDFRGKLGPLQLGKLLWRAKVHHPDTARLVLLGIRKELRGQKRFGGLSTAMYVEIAQRGHAKGYRWGEMSLTLEDNHPVNLGARYMGAKVYKTYRMYEKPLI